MVKLCRRFRRSCRLLSKTRYSINTYQGFWPEHGRFGSPLSAVTDHAFASHPGAAAAAMTPEEERELRQQLARLQQEHRDLDAAIAALQDSPGSDVIQLQRLKKRKLQLRDRITFIEDELTPDIIA